MYSKDRLTFCLPVTECRPIQCIVAKIVCYEFGLVRKDVDQKLETFTSVVTTTELPPPPRWWLPPNQYRHRGVLQCSRQLFWALIPHFGCSEQL